VKSAALPPGAKNCRRGLILVLAVAYALRVWLACEGGQLYWPDEKRYVLAEYAANDLWQGHWRAAASRLVGEGQHTLFPDFGLVPALAERFTGLHLPLVACYFGLFSVLAIFLIWAIARRAGAGEEEALWAAYLAACANCLFYYSRHFFPYDISLCEILLAVWFGLGPWSWRNSLRVGAAAGLGFLTYAGYWWLGGCALLLHAFLGAGGPKRIIARSAFSGVALVGVVLLVLGLSRALGHNLVSDDAQGAAVVFGDLSAPGVILAYLWQAEKGLLVLLLAGLGFALFSAWRERRLGQLAWYGSGIVLVLGGLILLSDPVLIPVFGRRIREVMPFLCLGAATGIVRFLDGRLRGRRAWAVGVALAAAASAAWNFSGPLRQVFPDQFERLAAAAAARQSGSLAYRVVLIRGTLLNERWDEVVLPYPAILRRPHPLQFRPYQYEGYNAAQRAEIDDHDISMRLLALRAQPEPAEGRWLGYPGPMRLRVRFPAAAAGGFESLVATGQTGRGDILYVHYLDAGHLEFGLDHWGVRGTTSAPVAVDYSHPHELVLLAGFLLPPAEPADHPRDRLLFQQRDRLLLLLDGRPVFSLTESFYPIPAQTISFGVNFIGGSLVGPEFTGEILEFGPVPDSTLAALGFLP
jgi:Dolichyl-phosphate-mannose-protein mannosyltransferase